MAVTLKRFCTGTVGTDVTTMFTADGESGQIDALTLTNNSGASASVTIWAAAGGGATNETIILRSFAIGAGASRKAYEVEGQVIPDGASLYAQATTAGVLTLVCSGRAQAT